MAVALAQPHRRQYGRDEMAATALGRFCIKSFPKDEGTRRGRYHAGLMYAETLDNERVAQGFAPRLFGLSADGPISNLTFEQLKARKDLAIIKLQNANGVLRDVSHKAIRIMGQLCYEDREIGASDEAQAIGALYKLALHFVLEKPGFHELCA